jgi:hypothetical protein
VYAARTADEGVKLALIADNPAVYFTTPHFDGCGRGRIAGQAASMP